MASNGVPVRLSAQLAERARKAAKIQERSLTEQVEHWARLGELLESTVSSAAVKQLKMVSHDPKLGERLAAADSPQAQRRTRDHVLGRGGPWYGTAPDDPDVIVRRETDGTETRGRILNGKFVAIPGRPSKRSRSA